MANSVDPDQMASGSQLIWIYIICKGRVYPGSAGQGLKAPYSSKIDNFYSVRFNKLILGMT